MKKWGFAGQGAAHGNSKAHRKAGGIGACQDPGKVWKGKKMAGRSGGAARTALSLRVAAVDADRGLVCVAGAVPGGAGSPVRVSDAVLARHGRQPVARPFPTKLVDAAEEAGGGEEGVEGGGVIDSERVKEKHG
jgi:large subunit ribosomal protein L3